MRAPLPSLLDNDLYKFTMGQVAHDYPDARVRYRFINRDNRPFRPSLGNELLAAVDAMAGLSITDDEYAWLRACAPWLEPAYLDWLRTFRFDPGQVRIEQDGTDLRITVEGWWVEAIYWEVPLLSLVSELHFKGAEPDPAWVARLREKADRLSAAGVHWIDFGARRRFSHAVHDAVVATLKPYAPLFRGTSDPHLAMKHGLSPQGTFAHELPMALQAKVGPRGANRAALDTWVAHYRGDLGIALTDTLTTDVFLRDFDKFYAKLFDGVRLDSGDPFAVGERILAHYASLKIDPCCKVFVFSDALSTDKAIALHERFKGRVKTTMGIGTHLTNDVGHKPLNIVMKLTHANFGDGWKGVVKLSDDPGKHVGAAEDIAGVKREIGVG